MARKDNNNICIKCKYGVVHNKKRQLCKKCYMKWWFQSKHPDGKNHYYNDVKIQHSREIEFSKNFFNHKNWVYHPAVFRLSNIINYEPDFYDGERNVFIEVVGSHQAFYQNLAKYKQFTEEYPLISFEIRQHTGEIISLGKKVQNILKKKST